MSKFTGTKIITEKSANRLLEQEQISFLRDEEETENHLINIYPELLYQEIEGFGGAFTEAAAYTLSVLPGDVASEAIRAYFGPDSNRYTYCRTHINSCDFALGNYAYVEDENDQELKTFSIERDRKYLLPMIKEASKLGDFELLASPWSPPPYMKTNGQMNHGGKLRDEYRLLWAKYIAKYIKEYQKEGVKITALSMQNEPKATQRWDSCVYTAEEERDLLRDAIGPVLEEEGLGHIKLMIWDHNKERLFERADTVLRDGKARALTYAAAFHWYSGDHFEALRILREKYPEIRLIHSEGCVEQGVTHEEIRNAERYAHDIIGNLNNGMNAYIDWNMLLDERGGPNHVGNFCDAPIICDTKEGSFKKKLTYYYIGHFSRFIPPGSKRIAFTRYTDKLEVTAFLTKAGERVVVVLNRGEKPLNYIIREEGYLSQNTAPAKSITTVVYR